MNLLNDLLSPFPIAALALLVFGLVFFWLITKCFRVPGDFEAKEAARDEIRYMLFDQEQQKSAEAAQGAEEAEREKEADGAGAPPGPAPAPGPETAKKT